MKKQRLSLNELKVQSFVTHGAPHDQATAEVKGGIPTVDVPSFNDFTCWIGGGCDSDRCDEGPSNGCSMDQWCPGP